MITDTDMLKKQQEAYFHEQTECTHFLVEIYNNLQSIVLDILVHNEN